MQIDTECYLSSVLCPLSSDKGIGLVAAVFVIVILAMFGLLVARYITTSAVTSVEDHLWAQALYSAESAAQLHLLGCDGGGNWPTGKIGDFDISILDPADPMHTDPAACPNPLTTPATLVARASRIGISRAVEVKFLLQ